MRVNIYSQELTDDVKLIEKQGNDGRNYSAISLFLHSSNMLHQPPGHTGSDDDRSAVTLWLPKSTDRREELAKTLERMAELVRKSPPETSEAKENLACHNEHVRQRVDVIEEIISIRPTFTESFFLRQMGFIELKDGDSHQWVAERLSMIHTRVLTELVKALRTQSVNNEWWLKLAEQDWFKLLHRPTQRKDYACDIA